MSKKKKSSPSQAWHALVEISAQENCCRQPQIYIYVHSCHVKLCFPQHTVHLHVLKKSGCLWKYCLKNKQSNKMLTSTGIILNWVYFLLEKLQVLYSYTSIPTFSHTQMDAELLGFS